LEGRGEILVVCRWKSDDKPSKILLQVHDLVSFQVSFLKAPSIPPSLRSPSLNPQLIIHVDDTLHMFIIDTFSIAGAVREIKHIS
jgi:hypothetical protein